MPRRTHTKSRYGCDQCKKRRVKCDEKSPCSNCICRELKCTFFKIPKVRSTTGNGPSIQSLPSDPTTSTSPSTNSLGTIGTASYSRNTALRDLELMHQFSTETYQSLCTDPSEHHVWQVMLPRKALSHDFLLSGILALASLHIATTMEPAAALSYIDTALQYHNQAFAPFREAIDNLTPFNCDAVFAHSIITTVVGIALPRLTAERGEPSSMTENIVVVFELLQGVSKIRRISRPWLKTRLFSSYDFWNSEIGKLETETETSLNRLVTLNDKSMTHADPAQRGIHKHAISLLHYCFARFARSRDVASVLAWLAAVDKEFVYGLRRRQPFPLLILMHWGVLLGQLDGELWWARNSGRALVSELFRVVGMRVEDREWEEARVWPQRKMGP